MSVRAAFIFMVAAVAIYPNRPTAAASWNEIVCGSGAKLPFCVLFNSAEQVPEDVRLRRLKEGYLAKLDKWTMNAETTTMQDQVVTSCGVLTIVTAPPDTARSFVRGEKRDEFDARVDACTKLTAHRAWPQPQFTKPETIDLVCNRWTSLIRELCIRAKLNT